MNVCIFPDCHRLATGRNRANQPACGYHQPVVVGTCDDLGDHKRHTDEGDDQ